MKSRDMGLLLLLGALWGSSFAFIRVAVPAFGPMGLAGFRVLVGGVLLAVLGVLLKRSLDVRPYAGRLLVLGGMNAAVPFTLISAAELELTASLAALLNATAPLFAAGFGALWMGERFTVRRSAGLVAGVVGVGVMVGWSPVPLTGPVLLAVVAMLVATASYAASGFFVRKRLAGVPTHTLALGQQMGALAWLAVPVLVWAPRSMPQGAPLMAALALAVLSTTVAYLIYFRLLERIGPTRTSTVTYLLPAFGLLWGALFLGEAVTAGMLLGFGLILVSLLLVNGGRLGEQARPEGAGAGTAARRGWRRRAAVAEGTG